MKTFFRRLSLLTAFFGILNFIELKSGWPLLLMPVKVLAGGLAPLWAALGALSALFGQFFGDNATLAAGLTGAALGARHTARSVRPHDVLARTFGVDWEQRLPARKRALLAQTRFQPLPLPGPAPRVERDVVIGTHVETDAPLWGDLWLPPAGGASSGMALVFLHSSGWHYSNKDMGTRPFFSRMTAQGHVVLDVAYTLAPGASFNAMFADVRRAVAWMKQHAKLYRVDPARVVLAGASAGAHLALLAAYTAQNQAWQTPDVTDDTRVHAVVAFYPPTDLLSAHAHLARYPGVALVDALARGLGAAGLSGFTLVPPSRLLPSVLGSAPEQDAQRYRQASPLTYVGAHCPPTLILHGTHDSAVEIAQARKLAEALRAAGVVVAEIEYEGGEHFFDLIGAPFAPGAQAATDDVERFLAAVG